MATTTRPRPKRTIAQSIASIAIASAIGLIGFMVCVGGSSRTDDKPAVVSRQQPSATEFEAKIEAKFAEDERARQQAALEENRRAAIATANELPPAELKKRRVKFAKDVQSLIRTLGYPFKTSAQGKNGEDLVFSGDGKCDESALFEVRKGVEGFTDYAPAAFKTIRCAGKDGAWIMANP